jgi:alpha-glucosidase (family GH31 glycosyl hydrolase)
MILLLAVVTLTAGETKLTIDPEPARLSLEHRGAVTAGAHPGGSLLLGTPDRLLPASLVSRGYDLQGRPVFEAATPEGRKARVTVALTPHQADFLVQPAEPMTVLMRFAPASPGYGLADHAVTRRPSFDTDITGYSNDTFLSGAGLTRLVSNFVIYPKQKWAFLVWEPGVKIVRSTDTEVAQGVRLVESNVRFTVFTGTPREIYRGFLESRNQYGYAVMKPKYEFFGVGWEAFGALAWDTNHKTVAENVDRYLAEGYPLSWMVVGSGFWPRHDQRFHETTSFGMYDKNLYPDPAGFIARFKAKGLKFFQGLRTTFVVDGPYTEEGVRQRFFVEENGQPKVFKFNWPRIPTYFLDWTKPGAVAWFADLARKWTSYGVDGFKEDVYGFQDYELRDDKLDSVNAALMREGLYVMGRNAYLASPADLHRINDFNYNQQQDRGPVNSLAYAYSGFPLVYPDIVGGTFGEGHFDLKVTPRMRVYMMRNAMWASVHPSMSMGQAPWTFGDKQVEEVMLAAARLHDRLQPFIYSQAVKFYLDGYPWPMTPLPVAFPDDSQVQGRENQRVRGYQWLIGDALLAAPLYGNDYETASSRDIYLPAGAWIEYDSGQRHTGPKLLQAYPIPPGRTPLFAGGSGVVVEKMAGGLVARVYPVSQRAESTFIHPDGLSTSVIRLDVKDWSKVSVRTAAGKPVPGRWERHAYEFRILAGENYALH